CSGPGIISASSSEKLKLAVVALVRPRLLKSVRLIRLVMSALVESENPPLPQAKTWNGLLPISPAAPPGGGVPPPPPPPPPPPGRPTAQVSVTGLAEPL